MSVNDIKPWFKEDIMRTLSSIYLASRPTSRPKTEKQADYQAGFADALAALALAVGGNPETFLLPEEIQRIKTQMR